MANPFQKFIEQKKNEVVQRATNTWDDEKNMAKWLKSPEGIVFSLKQASLQLTQPRLDNTIIDRLRFYDPLFPLYAIANINLPLKPGVYRHPAAFSISTPDYTRVKRLFNENSGINTNRLITIGIETDNVDLRIKKTNVGFFQQSDPTILKGNNKKIEIRSLRDVNGPGSFLGIGGTRYFMYPASIRNDEFEQAINLNNFKKTSNARTLKTNTIVNEYRRAINTPTDEFRLLRDQRVSEWEKEYNTSDYVQTNFKNSISQLQKYDSKTPYAKGKNGFFDPRDREWEDANQGTENDKIPIVLSGAGSVVRMKAYISNLSFGAAGQWSDQNFVGRPDILKIFDKNTRNIKFNMLFVPNDQEELKRNIKNIDKIIQFTYAKDINNSLSGIIVNVTVGKLFVDEPCILNAAPVTVPDDSPWSLDLEIPMHYMMNFDLYVLGKTSPYYGSSWLEAAKK